MSSSEEQPRNLAQFKRYRLNDEGRETFSSIDQIKTEASIERIYNRYEQMVALDPGLPKLYRNDHARYLQVSLERLSSSYECLDSSRPWIIYWIMNAASILSLRFDDELLDRAVDFLVKCRSKDGGFGGGPGQDPHLATTYAAVNALCIIGTEKALDAIDRRSLKQFLGAVRESSGAFRMHVGGELDVRGAYCAISSAKLVSFTPEEELKLFEGTAAWIAECQTYEGGFGGAPNLEAHGGYSFCAAAALIMLGGEERCDLDALLRWTVNRQMAYEGGFQGRTNKLVDGCYSFWQGALVPIVQSLIARKEHNQDILNVSLFHRLALQEYVMICCQKPNGGLIDKPGKPADLYHTCYALSGLAVAQHCETHSLPLVLGTDERNEVLPTHPVHNIPPKAALDACRYFIQFDQTETEFEKYTQECNRKQKATAPAEDTPENGSEVRSMSSRISEDDGSTSNNSQCTSSRASEERSMGS
ncbi:protein farnesyltransferase subunit beta [Anopheles bellator]|uniref:protein farnesyltransferase subunit beta n=1 Tax=Anopheles bellator TaxID=139047 RepID=UPI0026495840|nr:protein farnesyltransferase subunit beta [Anopheles bellator]